MNSKRVMGGPYSRLYDVRLLFVVSAGGHLKVGDCVVVFQVPDRTTHRYIPT